MAGHIVKSFDSDLTALDQTVAAIGGHCERLLSTACAALERRDPVRAAAAVASDAAIDKLERTLLDQAINLLARRQPMANDLRHVLTVIKIGSDLERIGDLSKNIAKRAIAIAREAPPPSLVTGFGHLADQSQRQLKDVLDAYATRDTAKALTVWRDDAGLDLLYTSLFQEMLTIMTENPRRIGLCTHLLFGAKNLERIGDHTTNIAESIHFLVLGVQPDSGRPKGDNTSSLSAPSPA